MLTAFASITQSMPQYLLAIIWWCTWGCSGTWFLSRDARLALAGSQARFDFYVRQRCLLPRGAADADLCFGDDREVDADDALQHRGNPWRRLCDGRQARGLPERALRPPMLAATHRCRCLPSSRSPLPLLSVARSLWNPSSCIRAWA